MDKILKLDKYITTKQANEWIANESISDIISLLNNKSKRNDKSKIYRKKITFNSIFIKLFDNKVEIMNIIQGLLSYERAYYINTDIATTKQQIGNKYKIYNILKDIEKNLRSKNSYIEYAKTKQRNEYLYLTTKAKNLLDIIDVTAKQNNISQIKFINYMLEVYKNITVYYINVDFMHSWAMNDIIVIKNLWNDLEQIKNNINIIFEIYNDMNNLIKDVEQIEYKLKILLIFYYENIEQTTYWEHKIYAFDIFINSFMNIKLYICKNYISNNNNINYILLLNNKFKQIFEKLKLDLQNNNILNLS